MKKLNRKSTVVATVIAASIMLALLVGGAAMSPTEEHSLARPPAPCLICETCDGTCITADGYPCDPYEPYEVPPECLGDNLQAPPAPEDALPIQPLALDPDNLSSADAPNNLIEPGVDAGPDVNDFPAVDPDEELHFHAVDPDEELHFHAVNPDEELHFPEVNPDEELLG